MLITSLNGAQVSPRRLQMSVRAEELQALNLAGRPRLSRDASARSWQRCCVWDADTERQLWALASSAEADVDVDVNVEEATAARTVRLFTVVLDTVGDGVRLTVVGCLPRRSCRRSSTSSRWARSGSGRATART